MKTITLGKTGLTVPAIVAGCMRINKVDEKTASRFIQNALDLGVNFFDHADIYGKSACEEIFSRAIGMNAAVREKIILQSKCGIVSGKYYDFSKEHILEALEGSLKRLKTDYLDVLLLHRPDMLVEPEEVAEAFDILHNSGKVRHFGVSNHNPMQIELLQKYVRQPLHVNQLQLSITNSAMIGAGIYVNTLTDGAVMRDGSVLDYCRLKDITIQSWSPFQYGTFAGTFLQNEQFPELNRKLSELAEKHRTTSATIAAAWILRHPAQFQLITGTWSIEHFTDCVNALEIRLSREDWYALYLSAGNTLP
ncbi:MAG: aldo/keto reductase [Treponema sp.]|nr:aldo/keto reductase [Treponema sp.]